MAVSIYASVVAALLLGGQAAMLRNEKPSLDSYSFAQFVTDYSRNYAVGSDEYARRATVYQVSLDRINAVNAKNIDEGRAWTAGVHPFMDWNEAERRSMTSGYKSSRMQKAGAVSMAAIQMGFSSGTQSNTSYDGQAYGSDSGMSWEGVSVRQQGSCGSCWAISAAEAVEARLPGKEQVSAQALVDCVPNPQHCGGKGGCDGATGELAYAFIRDHGLPLESNYAYTAETGSCPMNPLQGSFPAERRARISGWTNLPSNKAEPLMQALYNQGPVVVAVDANDWFDYDAGVFDGCKKDAELGHAVLAKGYGGEGNGKYWRIQNSWGANWGEQGHIRMKRRDAAEEEGFCGQDRKPQDGLGCDGGPPEITVCGMCGILYDPIYPEGVTIESGDAATDTAAKSSFRGYKEFSPRTAMADVPKSEDFTMPAQWSATSAAASPKVDEKSVLDGAFEDENLAAFSRPAEPTMPSDPVGVEPAVSTPEEPKIFRPAESPAKVASDMQKNAVEEMQDMLSRGKM